MAEMLECTGRGEHIEEDAITAPHPNSIHRWLRRHRLEHGIVRRIPGKRLLVPWSKLLQRMRVWFDNWVRLFSLYYHPCNDMRLISLDQKPSWFNNAGHKGTLVKKGGPPPGVKENFSQTRERYTILTCVRSWGNDDPTNPPPVAILFKGKQKGQIWSKMQNHALNDKTWMRVQCQACGSYRSADVVEALEWMLPDASSSEESVIVLLDWFSGHLTDEVATCIKSKGHVLLLHGGGTTPFTQVNDTHLHASLQAEIVRQEIEWSADERVRLIEETKKCFRAEAQLQA